LPYRLGFVLLLVVGDVGEDGLLGGKSGCIACIRSYGLNGVVTNGTSAAWAARRVYLWSAVPRKTMGRPGY
jgi:hypothetical protein